MRLIYLASPYTHKHVEVRTLRYKVMVEVVAAYITIGEHVFSPIAHCHPSAEVFDLPKDFDFWEKIDKDFISRCDELHVICLPGWQISKGVIMEAEFAKSLAKPVTYVQPPDNFEVQSWITTLQELGLGPRLPAQSPS